MHPEGQMKLFNPAKKYLPGQLVSKALAWQLAWGCQGTAKLKVELMTAAWGTSITAHIAIFSVPVSSVSPLSPIWSSMDSMTIFCSASLTCAHAALGFETRWPQLLYPWEGGEKEEPERGFWDFNVCNFTVQRSLVGTLAIIRFWEAFFSRICNCILAS